MTKLQVLATSIFLVMTLSSYGQASKTVNRSSYFIDPSIKTKIDNKIISSGETTMASMDIKIFENDSVTWDTYATRKSIDQCITIASLDNDTINIISYLGFTAAFGYQIVLCKDTCIITHFAKSDAEIYKLKKSSPLTFGISVPCKTYKLTLVNKPKFKKDEIVEGIIELTSDEYFEVVNGNETKSKMQLTGYFKTEKLKSKEAK